MHRFFASLGNPLVFSALRKFREEVKRNMRVIGRGRYSEKEVSRLAKQCFQNYALKLLDYMAMHRLDSATKEVWVEKEIGEENLVNALSEGKGVLCITPHLGNWELGGYVLASKGYPINILTLREESQYLSSYEKRLREKAKMDTITIDPKDKPNLAILEIAGRLRRNEIVAMVADRIYEGKGVEIDFFGQPTLFPTGAVQLALETGAIIIPVFVILEQKKKYWGIIDEPIPIRMGADKSEAVRQGVQEIAKRFEKKISQYPDQWFNFFPYWKNDVGLEMKNGSEASYAIGDRVVNGRVNQHRTLIQKRPEEIYRVLIDPEQMKRWCPVEQISVERVTSGEFRVGTKSHFKLRFRIEPEWDTEVIHLETNRQIASQFLNGIFQGGVEIWDLKKVGSGTEVTHTLIYKIHRWIYKAGWTLLGGEKKHDELTEIALSRLKNLLEGDKRI